ncbi:MAG: D-tagatose 3-epimerase [Planctomycetaceae bacterium]|jgi:sugar phosphate isomerase/epimerase|nr:D-tagatose 3-epimerase [Planctomycetaceae bacterium]MBP62032.1 D-tagatose 3-epimerase [Planctomycetaceae bacterium]
MKYAICNETFENWPFEKSFALAADLGYSGIEFAPFTINKQADAISAEERATIRGQIEDAGLQTVGLHWLLAFTEGLYLTSPEQPVRDRTGTYLAELARLCSDLGGRILVLGSPQQRNLLPGVSLDQGMDLAADVIRKAVPAFEEHNVMLALEPLSPAEGDFLLTADQGIDLMRRVDSEHVRLHLDVKAMSSESRPIPDIIRDAAPYLIHFHANDVNLRGPGMGEVDFVPILKALQQIDYQGWVCVEVFDYKPSPEYIASESIKYLEACLRKVVEAAGE